MEPVNQLKQTPYFTIGIFAGGIFLLWFLCNKLDRNFLRIYNNVKITCSFLMFFYKMYNRVRGGKMKTFHYTIREPYGIHARPAVMLAGESRKYNCNITVSFEGQTADASDMIAVMGLNIQFGDKIIMEFTGLEEEQAYNGMKDFLLNSQIF